MNKLDEIIEKYFDSPVYSVEKTTKKIALEFAKHVLEEVSEKMYETYHTVCEDGTVKGGFRTQKEAIDLANTLNRESNLYHDYIKVVRLGGGMDKQSITDTLNKYL